MRLPVLSRLVLAAVLLSIPAACPAGFDLSKLDSPIDLVLQDSSMADAAFALAESAEIDIAAPAGPKGLTASLRQETLREVLNTLTKMSGLGWHIENGVIVFKEAPTLPAPPPKESMTPVEGMTAFLASLGEVQIFLISRGFPLPYAELTPAQQEIVRAMLSPGEGWMPKPEEVGIAFRVMPALVIPKTAGGEGMTLRLHSMPYMELGAKGGERN